MTRPRDQDYRKTCENGRFDDRRTADNNNKTYPEVLNICNRSNTYNAQKLNLFGRKAQTFFAAYKRIKKTGEFQSIIEVE